MIVMKYDPEEFGYLCTFFAACRDALRRHPSMEELAWLYDELGTAVWEDNLTADTLKKIKTALINGYWLSEMSKDDEVVREIWELHSRALLRTVAILKETGP